MRTIAPRRIESCRRIECARAVSKLFKKSKLALTAVSGASRHTSWTWPCRPLSVPLPVNHLPLRALSCVYTCVWMCVWTCVDVRLGLCLAPLDSCHRGGSSLIPATSIPHALPCAVDDADADVLPCKTKCAAFSCPNLTLSVPLPRMRGITAA